MKHINLAHTGFQLSKGPSTPPDPLTSPTPRGSESVDAFLPDSPPSEQQCLLFSDDFKVKTLTLRLHRLSPSLDQPPAALG